MTSSEPYVVKVSFEISGFTVDPSEVSARLGVSPTDVHREGEPKGRTQMRWKHNLWILRAPKADYVDVADAVEELMAMLPARLDALTSVDEAWTAQFSCAVYIGDSAPAVALEAPLLVRVAALPAGLDIDLYAL